MADRIETTHFIDEIIGSTYPTDAAEILSAPIIKYLKRKTNSVGANAKARSSFANIYAIYVLVEDYIQKGYMEEGRNYSEYEGADFTPLLIRQRQLPFGSKLQNHALNNRLNHEFEKFHDITPILINSAASKYRFNEDLLIVNGKNIAPEIIKIIEAYIVLKSEKFEAFFERCKEIAEAYNEDPQTAISFVKQQLEPSVDARIFEIVSFCIIKYAYIDQTVYFGTSIDNLQSYNLVLYKTGRTNANDGGIDFIMKPLGKVFQVTEDLNFKKYFLDIDKLNKFPITFVVKTALDVEEIMKLIKKGAKQQFDDKEVINKYLNSFEGIINIPKLHHYLEIVIREGNLNRLLEELIIQCKVEYNISDTD